MIQANRIRHGLTLHPLFKVWSSMKGRCYNEKDTHYKEYGGRGIKVCDEWLLSFPSFYDWCVSNGWEHGLEIDRYPNNDGNYEPNNCRFVTPSKNCRNRRSNRMITYNGETLCVNDWADKTGIPAVTLFGRLANNWPVEKLFRPVRNHTEIEINGEVKTLTEWSKVFEIPKETVLERYRKGVRGDKLFYKGNMRSYQQVKS